MARGPLRWILFVSGLLFLGLGAIGVVLPLLPTTPFVLLAAACFARSSPRLHQWLLANRVFGPTIHEWYEHGRIPRRAKVTAVALITVIGGSSIAFVVEPRWAKGVMAAVLLTVMVWLVSRPTAPTPMRG